MGGGAYTEFGQLTTGQAHDEVVQVATRHEHRPRTTIHVGEGCAISASGAFRAVARRRSPHRFGCGCRRYRTSID